jgi:hypothetical protein
MKHEFHFILNQDLYFKLLKLSKVLNKSQSATIILAFESLNVFIEKNHLSSQEYGSKYRTLALPGKKNYHIHCYLTENLYRRLKHIHHDLNTYSLAQIMRKIIENFLIGCFKYGVSSFINNLKRINKNWEKNKITYQREKRIFIRHMSCEFIQLPYCKTIYGTDSRPYLMQLI